MKYTIQELTNIITEQSIKRLHDDKLDCDANLKNAVCRIKPGKKYTKIDQGTSGKYMVDSEGNIFGIKAYGVIHHGHCFGTLDTVDEYDWSGYRAVKIK